MMKKLLLSSLFLFSFAATAASDPLVTAEKWASCVSHSDIACLDTLLSDNYRHTHGTGLVETKQQFITALKNGSRKYDPIHFENLDVQTTDHTTIVLGKFNLKVLSNGNTLQAVNRFGLVIVNTPAGEKIVYFQATPMK